MAKLYDIYGNEIAVSADDSAVENGDTLLGTLPYKIGENGCYIISDTDTTISTGKGAEQLLDLESNVTFSLAAAERFLRVTEPQRISPCPRATMWIRSLH